MKDFVAAIAAFLLVIGALGALGLAWGWRDTDLDREGLEYVIFGRPCPSCVDLEVPMWRIEPGQVVRPSDLMTVSLPPEYIPETAVVLRPAGATAKAVLYAGQLVRRERLE